jgi:hypothetical protein
VLHALNLGTSKLQILFCYQITMVMLDESKKWGPNANWLFATSSQHFKIHYLEEGD